MNRKEIERILNRAMIEEFEVAPEKLVPEAMIKDDLGLDSLDIVDMVVILEAAFRFTISDKSALLKIQTLGDVAGFIEDTAGNAAKAEEKEECAVS